MDEYERLVTLLTERVSNMLSRMDDYDKKQEANRQRTNQILVGVIVALVLLVVNVAVERM